MKNKYIPQIGDRVVAVHENAARKGRVATIPSIGNRVGVTFSKTDTPITFITDQVFPLYRWTPFPAVLISAGKVAPDAQLLLPLFDAGK